MWTMLKVLSIPAILVFGVLVLYSLSKVARAENAATTKPDIEVDVPGVTITRTESAQASASKSEAMMMLLGSGAALTASVATFGYAAFKGRRRPGVGV